MKKKYILFFVLIHGILSMQAQPYFAGGDGTSGKPWQISNPEQLVNLLTYYSGNAGVNRYFELTENISMGMYIEAHFPHTGLNPLNDIIRFNGHLDGKGHTISGIWKKDTQNLSGGLFGTLERGGSLRNIEMKLGEKGIQGRYFAGGIVGINLGTISACFVSGGMVASLDESIGIGGIAGQSSGVISCCHANCFVSGKSHVIFSDVLPPGIGGLVGINEGQITDSYFHGNILSFYGGGALAGLNKTGGKLSNCHYDIDLCEMEHGIGHDQNNQGEIIEGKETYMLKKKLTFTHWNFESVWKLAEDCTYPLLKWEQMDPDCSWCFKTGDGTIENPYLITDAVQLDCLRFFVGDAGAGKHFVMTADIDLEPFIASEYPSRGWLPVGGANDQEEEFRGYIHGRGHVIKGLWINRPYTTKVGLFGKLGKEAVIEELGVIIKPSASVKGNGSVGGLAGYNSGKIYSCFVDGTVESTSDALGGVVGFNSGRIENSYSTGKVIGPNFAGGLVGWNFGGAVTSCYTTCNVRESNGYYGALVGYNMMGTVTSSFYDFSECGTGGSGISKNTAQMKQKLTFAGWDFAGIWKIFEEVKYPVLYWQVCEKEVSISGPLSAKIGGKECVYETEGGNNYYRWVLEGGVITDGSGTHQIKVRWNTPGTHTISVNYLDAKGCFSSNPPKSDIHVSSCDLNISLSGSGIGYDGNASFSYSTESGKNAYNWIVTGGHIIFGQGSSQIAVVWNSPGSKKISVDYRDEFGCAVGPKEMQVTVYSCIPDINLSGPVNVKEKSTGNIYTTESGKDDYIWMLTGGTITSGKGTRQITVTWNTVGNQSVSVNYKNEYGCSAASPKKLAVTVKKCQPLISISGPTLVNSGSTGNIYTTQPGMNDYAWTVIGGTITSSQNTNTITVTWNQYGFQYVSVNYKETDGCLSSNPPKYNVMVLNNVYTGAGTMVDPYQLKTAKDIDNLRTFTGSLGEGRYFKVMNDINLSQYIESYYSSNGWKPIGSNLNGDDFRGNIEGNGKKISDLNILNSEQNCVGLFGVLGRAAFIKNLALLDHTIMVYMRNSYVGSLAGINAGGTIINCYNSGFVEGFRCVGGMVGENQGDMKYCRSYSRMDGAGANWRGGYENVGGLVGVNSYNGIISCCYAYAWIDADLFMGGLVGLNNGSVLQSCSDGVFNGDSFVGGLVGYSSQGEIALCYAMGFVSGPGEFIGGLTGKSDHLIDQCYSACEMENPDINTVFSGGVGTGIQNSFFDAQINGMNQGTYYLQTLNNEYVELQGFNTLDVKYEVMNMGWGSLITNFNNRNPYPYLYWQQYFEQCSSWRPYLCWDVDMWNYGYDYDLFLDNDEIWKYSNCNTYYPSSAHAARIEMLPINEKVNKVGIVDKKKEMLNDTLLKNTFYVFPNPTTGIIHIETPEKFPDIEVYTINGILVKKTNDKMIDLSSNPSGIYFIKINAKVVKLIKQ